MTCWCWNLGGGKIEEGRVLDTVASLAPWHSSPDLNFNFKVWNSGHSREDPWQRQASRLDSEQHTFLY